MEFNLLDEIAPIEFLDCHLEQEEVVVVIVVCSCRFGLKQDITTFFPHFF